MLLNIEKYGEKDKEYSKEWLVNTDPGMTSTALNNEQEYRMQVPTLGC